MKKLLAIILSTVMAFSLPLTALADNGPMGNISLGNGESINLSYVSLIEFDENDSVLDKEFAFDGQNAYDSINGVSYNKASNTLSLNNFNSADVIETNVMGDDFKINVTGSCSVGQIRICGDHYGGGLTIDGSGTLTVNQSKRYDNAIVLYAEESNSALSFGENVNVNLYAKADAVYIEATSKTDTASAIKFGNGQSADVTKENYVEYQNEYVDIMTLSNPDVTFYGEKAVCTSDPGGIYTISEGYKDENPDETYYWVNKYFYVAPFDAYTEDYGFGDFGSIEMTEEEFKNQTEFSVVMKEADYPEELEYYEKDDLEAEYAYCASKITNPADPNGVYGYTEYYKTDYEGNVTEEGVNIYRFVLADGTDKYIIDESFEQLTLTNEEFACSDYSIVYAMESEWLEWQGYVNKNTCAVYKDKSSNKYAINYDGTVYDYAGKLVVNIGSTDYYCAEENTQVSPDSLEVSVIAQQIDGFYSYTLKGTEFIYKGGHTHTLKTTTTKATTIKDGKIVKTCTVCGKTISTTVIPKASSIKLEATSLTYNGKVRTPRVIVKDSKGKTISSSNYTVSYASGRKNVGKYAVKITFKGNYTGTKTLYFTINPKSTSISSISAKSKGFTAKWKKQSTQVTGYQIQYSTSSKFKSPKYVTVSSYKATSKTISKLKGKKKYYVRIRTYKTVGKTKYYSSWSKSKSVTTKK